MPPMDRDDKGRCLKKNDGIAGQSLNAKDPPHDTPWPLRTTRDRAAEYFALVRAAGHRGRPDCLVEAIALFAAVLGMAPLPPWVDITDFK